MKSSLKSLKRNSSESIDSPQEDKSILVTIIISYDGNVVIEKTRVSNLTSNQLENLMKLDGECCCDTAEEIYRKLDKDGLWYITTKTETGESVKLNPIWKRFDRVKDAVTEGEYILPEHIITFCLWS